MKRVISFVFAIVMLLSLLAACHKDAPETTTAIPVESTPGRIESRPTVQQYSPYLDLGQSGKIRVNHTVNISSAKYITSVEQLPNYDGLEQFDQAYFAENALLIVFESVANGSAEVQIDSVKVEESTATVTLEHWNGSGLGTGQTTTWLLWVEVERGLEYDWIVANPALDSDVSAS